MCNNVILFYRIYDGQLELIQVSRGHEDDIRDILHIPELDQVPYNGKVSQSNIFQQKVSSKN